MATDSFYDPPYYIPVLILKGIAVAITGVLAVLMCLKYIRKSTRITQYLSGFFICFFFGFLLLFLNHIVYAWQSAMSGPALIMANFGNYFFMLFVLEVFYDERQRYKPGIRAFLWIFLLFGIAFGLLDMYFVVQYRNFESTGTTLPPVTYLILFIFTPLNLIVYLLASIKIGRAIQGLALMEPEELEALNISLGFPWQTVRRIYFHIGLSSVLQFFAIFFLLIDIYDTAFSVWAVIGWICYILSMLSLYGGYFLKPKSTED